MPQLTINLPESVMPWLARRAENENTTPEKYNTSLVLYSMKLEESCDQASAAPGQRQREDILEERDKGPFVPVPNDLADRVMEKAMARIRQRQAHV
ncbi:MAG: hypothetical protein NTV80_08845 [Verrucomicrobia bacterium]|nr:hypothetical protein [Verrucomicrobiota bacterium]